MRVSDPKVGKQRIAAIERGPNHPLQVSGAKLAKRLANKEDALALAMELGTQRLAESLPQVLEAVIQKAQEGHVACAKLVLERVLPPVLTRDAVSGTVNVQINVGAVQTASEVKDAQAIPTTAQTYD